MNEEKIKAEIAAMSPDEKQLLKGDLLDLRHAALDLAHEAIEQRSAEFDKRLSEVEKPPETATLEARIAARPAPKVTPADIEAEIAEEFYFTAAHGVHGRVVDARRRKEPDVPFVDTYRPVNEQDADDRSSSSQALSLLTFAVLVMKNGFTVTGESACASPENFDAQIGREVARKAAVQKMWSLMGWSLRNELTGHRPMATTRAADDRQQDA